MNRSQYWLEVTIADGFGRGKKTRYAVGPEPGSRSKKITHLKETRFFEPYGTPDEVCNNIREAAKGLIDPQVDIDAYTDYGDAVTKASVEGWRPMTDEELALYSQQVAEIAIQQAEREKQEFERIKAQHPDWLK